MYMKQTKRIRIKSKHFLEKYMWQIVFYIPGDYYTYWNGRNPTKSDEGFY